MQVKERDTFALYTRMMLTTDRIARVHYCYDDVFHVHFIIQPATVVGLVSTVRKSVIATTRTRTVRIIRQKVDVTPAVLHTSRGPLVKV